MGHAAEDEQRDAIDRLSQRIANHRVRQFMDHDRGEKKESAGRTDEPILGSRIARMQGGKITGREAPQDQDEDYQPGKIDRDLDSGDPEQIEFTAHLRCHCLRASQSIQMMALCLYCAGELARLLPIRPRVAPWRLQFVRAAPLLRNCRDNRGCAGMQCPHP